MKAAPMRVFIFKSGQAKCIYFSRIRSWSLPLPKGLNLKFQWQKSAASILNKNFLFLTRNDKLDVILLNLDAQTHVPVPQIKLKIFGRKSVNITQHKVYKLNLIFFEQVNTIQSIGGYWTMLGWTQFAIQTC